MQTSQGSSRGKTLPDTAVVEPLPFGGWSSEVIKWVELRMRISGFVARKCNEALEGLVLVLADWWRFSADACFFRSTILQDST